VSQFVFKLPDLGEGTVEAEIVGWRVKPGDQVSEDDVIVEVMTEKAAVEVPSPVTGRVVSTTGEPGDMVPVGSVLIVIETGAGAGAGVAASGGSAAGGNVGGGVAAGGGGAAGRNAGSGVAAGGGAAGGNAAPTAENKVAAAGVGGAAGAGAAKVSAIAPSARSSSSPGAGAPTSSGTAAASPAKGSNGAAGVAHVSGQRGRVATSPAIRRRAHEAGVDLSKVPGSGPNGRIVREDFDAYVQQRVSHAKGAPEKPAPLRARPAPGAPPEGATEEIKVIGLRRLIAQRMSEAKRNIPHFAYVEEMDVTDLEALRRHLNSKLATGTPALTYLPFLVLALVRVLKDFPQANAQYDAERGVIIRHRAVHVGVATQTPDGLKVPVVRDAQTRSLWELAAEMRRVSEAARTNKATREELSGSTITVTSLGKLGGIASTPIINAPEVAIIGVNRAVERPVVLNGSITIRRMMNLSSSFDHRFVDGYDAAALIQALKERIEHPATIFIDT
jgi:2-oxoisovalerate dehydrogenase E2 component (dihydrolipoyl transacylase)